MACVAPPPDKWTTVISTVWIQYLFQMTYCLMSVYIPRRDSELQHPRRILIAFSVTLVTVVEKTLKKGTRQQRMVTALPFSVIRHRAKTWLYVIEYTVNTTPFCEFSTSLRASQMIEFLSLYSRLSPFLLTYCGEDFSSLFFILRRDFSYLKERYLYMYLIGRRE